MCDPKGTIDSNVASVQVMDFHEPNDKPSPEPDQR